ncbi:MAG: hypothetical protein M1830_006480, partial [Pleopsidium flavum]
MTRRKNHKPGWRQQEVKKQAEKNHPAGQTENKTASKMLVATDTEPKVEKVDTLAESDRPSKRAKVSDLEASDEPRFAEPTPEDHAWHFQKDLTFNIPVPVLPPELLSLQSKYEITSMSIISSSKIETKVKTLLTRLGKFSWANPNGKPSIVVLSAKAGVAGKMVSVVEIAKREIEADGAKWWQYSRVYGQMTELKEKPSKRIDGGKTLLEWEKKQAEKADAVAQDTGKEVEDLTMTEADGGEEIEEEAFETVAQNGNGALVTPTEEIEARKKIRAVP